MNSSHIAKYIYLWFVCKMSVVRFKKTQHQPTPTLKSTEKSKSMSMRVDVVPIPTGTNISVSKDVLSKQNAAIAEITKKGSDLFQSNRTVVSNNMGKRLYQTADLYGQTLAVEDLIPKLTENNLTLRLNAIRGGADSHTSCMELTTGKLADALEEEADSKQEKLVQVSLPNQPHVGRIFMGLKVRNGKHFIQKLDYEISTELDDKLHV